LLGRFAVASVERAERKCAGQRRAVLERRLAEFGAHVTELKLVVALIGFHAPPEMGDRQKQLGLRGPHA
jgi:hypothetical protein